MTLESRLLAGKCIVITGAGRGIGRALALTCAREGAVIGINYRNTAKEATALRAELEERFAGKAELLPFDVRDAQAISRALALFHERYGRIDGLVNNAAIFRSGLLISSPEEKIREVLDTNLLGPLLCTRAVLPMMLAQRAGVIIQIGSVAAHRPTRGQAVYAATKGGLESLTRALTVEYARKGIRAHTICPGPIDTRMLDGARALADCAVDSHIPAGRIGSPEDVAELAAFLLSDRASYITGATQFIDGGYQVG